MRTEMVRVVAFTVAVAACHPASARVQSPAASWLDTAAPAPWNIPGASIPAAPTTDGNGDPRCGTQARPVQLEEDRRLRERGWDLIGAYQGGWQTVVIRAGSGYDGMCRPLQFQDFVFVRGVFAGTLSPHPMDSRTDGAIGRALLQGDGRLVAEYARYAASDPLCCPSASTSVSFEISGDPPLVRAVSASTTRNGP
jgi:hypothetical protein